MEFIQSIDNSILQFIQGFRTPVWDNVFVFITKLGDDGFIWLVIALFLLLFKKWRKCGILVIVTVALVFLFGDKVIKHIIARDRPFLTYPLFPVSELLIKAPSGYSFPSGHSGTSFGAATAVFLYDKRFGTAAFCLAALIGFSRLYLYVHYPSDVLAGAVFGIGMGILTKFLIDYNIKEKELNGRI